MKRLFVFVLVLVFCLSGCKSLGEKPQDPMFVQLPMTAGQAYTDYEGMEILLTGLQYYPDEGTTLFTAWENKTAYDVTYSESYTIERLDGEEWVSCIKNENLGFHDIAYELKAGRQMNKNYDLTNAYDVSMPGAYRFQTVCYVHETGETSVKCVLTAEFIIGSEQEKASDETGASVEWCAQYIRTNGYQEGAEFPQIAIIKSLQELTAYYTANNDTFDLERKDKVYADTTIGFLDACEQFDEAFFENNYLVLVLLEEGSGSIRHEVRSVEQTADGKIAVSIDTKVPEVGTDDMAQWHIILEMSNTVAVNDKKAVQVYLDGRLAFDKGAVVKPIAGTQNTMIRREPPEAKLLDSYGSTPLVTAGRNWMYPNGDGTMAAVIVDHAHPLQCKDILDPIHVTGDYVKIAFEDDPDSMEVRCWPDTAWNSNTASSETVACYDIALDVKKGGYIYEIIAKWNESETEHFGSVSYYAYIVREEGKA